MNGACNPRGIIHSLALAVDETPVNVRLADSIDLKIVIGQLSFLLNESAGPTFGTIQAYQARLVETTA